MHVTGDVPPENLLEARGKIGDALAFFASEIHPGTYHLEAELNGAGYRTGYSFKEKKILFPRLENVRRFGLDSRDVVSHETFHALFCQVKAELCTSAILADAEAVALHEALADLFDYYREPDAGFGESYRKGRPYLRRYKTTLVLWPAEESYLRENALASLLLRNGYSLKDLKAFVRGSDTSLESLARLKERMPAKLQAEQASTITATPLNYPASSLFRFRVTADQPLRLRVTPSKELLESYPDWEIRATVEDGSALPGAQARKLPGGPGFEVEISVSASHPPLKAYLSSWSGSHMLGAKPIYLGSAF